MADALRTDGDRPAFPLPDTLARRMRAVTRILPEAEMQTLPVQPDEVASPTPTMNIEAAPPTPAPAEPVHPAWAGMRKAAQSPAPAPTQPAPHPALAPQVAAQPAPEPQPRSHPVLQAAPTAAPVVQAAPVPTAATPVHAPEVTPQEQAAAPAQPAPAQPAPPQDLGMALNLIKSMVEDQDPEDYVAKEPDPIPEPDPQPAAAKDDRWAILREPIDDDAEADAEGDVQDKIDPDIIDEVEDDTDVEDVAPAPAPEVLQLADLVTPAPDSPETTRQSATEDTFDDDYWGSDTPTDQSLLDAFADVAHLDAPAPAPEDAPSNGGVPLDVLILDDEPAQNDSRKRGLMGWMRRG